jgi:RloB-like protein
VSPDRGVRRARSQRGKSLSARPRLRKPRQIIYVVAEGEVTEYDYCTAIGNAFAAQLDFRINTPARHIRKNGMTPTEVAKHALAVATSTEDRRLDSASAAISTVSQVWALFDRDDHPRIPEALARLAMHERIQVAFSHPSFDLWLLLHFTAVSDPQGGLSELVHSRLRSCPGFDRFGRHDKRITQGRAAELMRPDRIAAAVRNAKTLVRSCPTGSCSASDGHADHCDPLRRDPSTDVWRLIECLGISRLLT